MELQFSLFYILMLLAGIILTVITIQRMVSGKISIPGWAKILLSLAMITMLVITLLGMLPVRSVDVDITEETVIVTP